MPKAKCRFTRSEIERATRGAIAAGLHIDRVEIDRDGKLVIFAGKEGDAHETEVINSCDAVLD